MGSLADAIMGVPTTRRVTLPTGEEELVDVSGSEASKGWERGVSTLVTGLQGAAGQAVQPFNEALGTAIIEDANAANQLQQRRAAPRVGSYTQINDLESLGDYVVGKGAETLPLLPLAYAGGLAGRAIGGTTAAAELGGTAAYAPMMAGQEAMQLHQDPAAAGLTPMQKALYSAGIGTAGAAAAAAVPAYMGGSLLAPQARSLTSNLLTRPVTNVALEGVGEAAEDVISQSGRKLYNPNATIDPQQVKESFVGGMAGMAPVAAAHAVPETIMSQTARGVEQVQPLVERGVQAGKEAATSANEQLDKIIDALPPELKAAVYEGKVKLEDVLASGAAEARNAVAVAKEYANAGAEAAGVAIDGAIEGGKKALREAYAKPDKPTALAEVHREVTGTEPKADATPAQTVKNMVDFFFSSAAERDNDMNTIRQRYNSPKGRKALAGVLEEMAQESEVSADSEFMRLLDVVKSDAQIGAQDAARLRTLASSLATTHMKLDALRRITGWQEETGETSPKRTDAAFSRTGDVVNKSVREMFGSSQMQEALAGMGVSESAVDRIVRTLQGSIQARDLRKRGLTRLANEKATEALKRLGLEKRSDLRAAIVQGVTEALGGHAERLPENERGGTDLSDTFVEDVSAAMEVMFEGQGRKAMPVSKADRQKFVDAAVSFITKLANGESVGKKGDGGSYASRASAFGNMMVRQWNEPAVQALQRIVESAALELGVDSPAYQRLQGLVESQGLVQRTANAISPHLNERGQQVGAVKTAAQLVDKVRSVLDYAAKEYAPNDPARADHRANMLLDALFVELSNEDTGILAGKSPAQQRQSFNAVVQGVRDFAQSEKAASRGGGTSPARTNLGEELEDLDTPEAGQDQALSVDGKDEKNYVPDWLGPDADANLGTDAVFEAGLMYSGTGMLNSERSGGKVRLGAPVTNMRSADYPYGMIRADKTGVQDLVHNETAHAVSRGKEISVFKWAEDMAAASKGAKSAEQFMREALAELLAFDQTRVAKLKAMDTPLAEQDLSYIRQRAQLAEDLKNVKNYATQFFRDEPLGRQYRYYAIKQEVTGKTFVDIGPEELAMFAKRDDETVEKFIDRMMARDDFPFDREVYRNSLMVIQHNSKDPDIESPLTVDVARLVGDVMRHHQKGDTGGDPYHAFLEIMASIEDKTGIRPKHRSQNAGGHTVYDRNLVILREGDSGGRGLRGERGVKRVGDFTANARVESGGKFTNDRMVRGADGKLHKADPGSLATPQAPLKNLMPAKVAAARKPYVAVGITSRIEQQVERSARGDKTVEKEVRGNLDLRATLARMLERNNLDAQEMLDSGDMTITFVAALMKSAIAELERVHGIKVDTGVQTFDTVELFSKQFGEETYPFTWGQVRKHMANMTEVEAANTSRDPEIVARIDAKEREQKLNEKLQELREFMAARKERKERTGKESVRDDATEVLAKMEQIWDLQRGVETAVNAQYDFDPEGERDFIKDDVMESRLRDESPTGKAKDTPLFDRSYMLGNEGMYDALQRIENELSGQVDVAGEGETYLLREARQLMEAMDAAGRRDERAGKDKAAPTNMAGLSISKHGAALNRVGKATQSEREGESAPLHDNQYSPTPPVYERVRGQYDVSQGPARPEPKEPTPKTVRRSEAPLVGKPPKSRAQLKAADIAKAEAAKDAAAERAAERATPRAEPEKLKLNLKQPPKPAETQSTDMSTLAAELAAESYSGAKHPAMMSKLSEAEKADLAQALRALGTTLKPHSAGAKLLKVLPAKAASSEVAPSQTYTLPSGVKVTKETDKMLFMPDDFVANFDKYNEREVVAYLTPRPEKERNTLLKRLQDETGVSDEGIARLRERLDSEAPFSRTAAGDKVWYGDYSHEVVEAAMQAEADKLLKGLKVVVAKDGVQDEAGKGVSGQFLSDMNQVLVSAWAPDGKATLNHEVWHGIEKALKGLGKEGQYVLDRIHAAMDSADLEAMLKERFANDPGALSQMNSPSERAAFAFQLFDATNGKLPLSPETRNWFQKIRDWVMEKIGWTSGDKQAEKFFKYIHDSGLLRDIDNPFAVVRALGETKTDKFINQTKEALKPVIKLAESVFSSSTERVLAHQNEHLNEIVKLYAGEHGKSGFHINHVAALNEFGHAMEKAVAEAKDEAALSKVETFKAVAAKLRAYVYKEFGKDKGAELYTQITDRVSSFNRDEVADNMEQFMIDLTRFGGVEAMEGMDKPSTIREIATKISERGYFFHPDVQLFKGHPEVATKWMDGNLEKQYYNMIIQTTKMVERHRAFGDLVPSTDAPDSPKIGAKLKELLDKAQKSGASKEAMQDIKRFMDAFDGKHDSTLSPDMKKLVGGVLFANNVALLPFALLAQLMEPMQLAMRKNDLPSVFKSTWRGLKDFPRMFDAWDNGYDKDYWEHFSEMAGSARARVLGESIAQLSNGIQSRGITGKMNDMFFRYNGMEGWAKSMHIEATKHAVEFLQDHANGIDPKHSERFLKELGVTAEEIKKAMTTELYKGSSYKSLELTDNIKRAINQYVGEAMAHPDAGSNPFWMNDPRFALLAQMKRFSFGFSRYVNDRNARELEHGNFGVLPGMVASIPWALLFIDPAKHLVHGTAVNEMGFIDSIMRGIELSGQTGKQQFVIDAMRQAQFGGSAIESLMGPTASMLGQATRDIAQARAAFGG